MIRHFAALRFKAETSEDTKAQLMADLSNVAGEIDGAIDFQVRTNISVEEALVRGFRHLYWWDFRDLEARDAYLEHPVHHDVGPRILEELEGGPDGLFIFEHKV